ncbi:MAG TPA: biotin/lipoyl-containing protein, partial [Steroidobacteraceae bacterium]|nr:biotin/lipoyl-containing protein [Steroidobacteraceae bacterium]
MSQFVFKLPDLGEGTVQAEIVGWRVKPGDVVAEDDVVVEVLTEKAAVEVPAPVSGRVVSTTGQPGDMVPVGAQLLVLETDSAGATRSPAADAPAPAAAAAAASAPPTR